MLKFKFVAVPVVDILSQNPTMLPIEENLSAEQEVTFHVNSIIAIS